MIPKDVKWKVLNGEFASRVVDENGTVIAFTSAENPYQDAMATIISCIPDMLYALQFYRDGFSPSLSKKYGGLEYSPLDRLLDDCGNKAQDALIKAGANKLMEM